MKNLNTVFPFYDALSEQYRYLKGIDSVPFILCPSTHLVPFIIRRLHNTGSVADITVSIIPVNGYTPIEVNGTDFHLEITYGSTYDYIQYYGRPLPNAIADQSAGYYLDIYDDGGKKHWYSETFSTRTIMPSCIYLEFSNNTVLGNIAAYFQQAMWIESTFFAPLYIREDEGEKRDGVLVKEKQIKMKANVIRMVMAPEYITDALVRLDMQDNASFIYNGNTHTILQAIIKDPEWTSESYGLYAKLEIQLIYDIEIKKLTFKETDTTFDDMATLRQGTGTTTLQLGGDYAYQVVFDDDMLDQGYTPAAYVISTGDIVEAQLPKITNITIHGFLITTYVACEVRWSAIKK